MKNITEFIKNCVKLNKIENSEDFGLYPFPMYSIEDNNADMFSLAFGGDVEKCYNKFIQEIIGGKEKIFMALDFPPIMDMEQDFICICEYESNENELTITGIPFCVKTGDLNNTVTEKDNLALQKIRLDFCYVLQNYFK